MNAPEPLAPSAPPGRILCQRGDGIGGRLLTLLWTMRLAAKVDAGVLMFWPRLQLFYDNRSDAGDIFDLYRLASPPFQGRLQIVDGDCRNYFRARTVNLRKQQAYDPRDFVVPVDMDASQVKAPVICGHWEGPFLSPGETPETALAEARALFATLPLRGDLMGQIDRLAGGQRLSRMVAVHVRRGEIVRNLRQAVSELRRNEPGARDMLDERIGTFTRRCMSVNNFADAVRPFVDRGREILVFSDEAGAARDLADALGTSEILSAASLIEGGLTPLQQAFVEAVLMSSCSHIVGARSAYSRLANVIGGNKHIVLGKGWRSPQDCAAYLLQSISEELLSHPKREYIERRVRELSENPARPRPGRMSSATKVAED